MNRWKAGRLHGMGVKLLGAPRGVVDTTDLRTSRYQFVTLVVTTIEEVEM